MKELISLLDEILVCKSTDISADFIRFYGTSTSMHVAV